MTLPHARGRARPDRGAVGVKDQREPGDRGLEDALGLGLGFQALVELDQATPPGVAGPDQDSW